MEDTEDALELASPVSREKTENEEAIDGGADHRDSAGDGSGGERSSGLSATLDQ